MTNFTLIYDKFLSKVTDFSIAKMDQIILEEELKQKLIIALSDFPALSDDKKVFSENGIETTFDTPLSIEEQNIIASLMVINYLDKFIINEDNMRIQLNSKDYKQYSQATLLKELKALKSEYQSDVDAKMNAYGFRQKFRSKRD